MSGNKKDSTVMVLACSGGSNVGQIANETALMIERMGRGQMSCAAALAARSGSVVELAQSASMLVAIDGCQESCVLRTLEREGYKVDVHVVAEDLNIEKSHDFTPDQIQIDRVVARAVTQIKAVQTNSRQPSQTVPGSA